VVDKKANKIVAIPDVLSLFVLSGVTVTIDAMGCQRAIAQQIVEWGGDYVLALKGNQGILHKEVRLFMEDLAKKEAPAEESCEKEHGRIETRRVWVSDRIDWIEGKCRFTGLKSLVQVEAVRAMGDKTSTECRCFLSSLPPDAKRTRAF
jgi:predicted transposase YbfD/YdcC